MGAVPFVGEKMAHGGQKKEGAKPAPLSRLTAWSQPLLQETREKFLREVLGVVRGMAFPADKSVERIPVNLAKMLQCFVRQLGIIAAGRQITTLHRVNSKRPASAAAFGVGDSAGTQSR